MSANVYRIVGEGEPALVGHVNNGSSTVLESFEPAHAVALFTGVAVSKDGFTVEVYEQAIEVPETEEEIARARSKFLATTASSDPSQMLLATNEHESKITPTTVAEVHGVKPEQIGIVRVAGYMIKNIGITWPSLAVAKELKAAWN